MNNLNYTIGKIKKEMKKQKDADTLYRLWQSILRFTPAATEIINLRPGDTGRPVAHIATNLIGYDSLVADVEGVMETLIPREEDVQTKAGGWYRLRIQPYRTLENVIEGAVLTFVNITEVKRAEAQLTVSNEELAHFNRLMAGRELRMIELKQEVNDLAAQLGRPQPHQLAFLDAASSEVLRTTPKPTDPDGANFTERNTKE